jgi:uncharacterized protein (TIRG00374 family)
MSEPTQDVPAEAAQTKSRTLHRLVPRAVISLLIAGGFVWALQRGGLPLSPPLGALPHLRWWGIPVFVALTVLCNFFRTYRLVFLLRPLRPNISRLRVLAIGFIGYGAIFFAPLRLGEMVRPYLLTQDEGIPFGQGLGVVAAERIIDGLVTVLMTALGLAFSVHVSPLPDHIGALPIPISVVPGALKSATVLFGVAFVGMAGAYATRTFTVALVQRCFSVISPTLGAGIARILGRVLDGFAFLPSRRSAGGFVVYTLGCWLSNAAALWALLAGVGLPASLAVACVTTGIIALGSLLPAGPGFFGAYQIATYTSLAMFFVPAEVVSQGAIYVFGSYASHVLINVAMTLLGFYLLARARAQ